MKLFSKIISFLFHPMLMPTLGLFFIFSAGTHLSYIPFEIKRLAYFIIFISSCLLPISLLPLFLQMKVIKSFRMETARERIFPVLTTGVFYFLGYFFLRRLNISPLIENFVLAILVAVLLAVGISFFWKISLHAIAVGGITATLAGMMFKYGVDLILLVSLMLVVSGLTATARLYLNAHSPSQVYVGYATGFIIVFLGVFLV
ncbi:PAP2 family protein [Marinilabilia sp.]|uniref:PAP2 family protein n=1 Tax=Marinilabilia sp. TaxID=2021252 RepID=UPI0025C7356B|nr:PAP2 family protein [Marinilabilia sp.]